MDTTDKYIEMCNSSKEIQSLIHISEDGNNFEENSFFYGYEPISDIDNIIFESMPDFKDSNVKVWLPRQDQLQEFLKFTDEDLKKHSALKSYDNYLSKFCGWQLRSGGLYVFYSFQYKQQFESMEQLWLAFVMHEYYHKMWNGTNWITKKQYEKLTK